MSGANVTVYAVGAENGEVNPLAGTRGVLGTGGPTDDSGTTTVTFGAFTYVGPIQVVASGATLSYRDPSQPRVQDKPAPMVHVPSTFVLSSYIPDYRSGTSLALTVTLYTTLADHEALAALRGRHALHPAATSLGEALFTRDPLFVRHFSQSAAEWSPSTLRTTLPVSLIDGPVTFVDGAYAALFDVALNQLARDTVLKAGFGADSSAITAITLAQLLEDDLDADAQLNGRGGAGRALVTTGTTPVAIDSQFLRKPLAEALDTWIQNTDVNKSGIREIDLIGAQVFSAIAQDSSDLFGDPPAGSFDVPIDRTPPILAWAAPPPGATADVSVSFSVTALDAGTGVKRVLTQVGSELPAIGTLQPDGRWILQVRLAPGPNSISVWAEDNGDVAGGPNTGQFLPPPFRLSTTVIRDNGPPTIGYNAGFASYRDERGMSVLTDAGGRAIVPAVYTFAIPAAITIPPAGGHVYKAATRVSWASTPTVAILEDAATGNPDNIPVLQFLVPYVAGVDAPIARAQYSVAVGCFGCTYPATPFTDLWPSSTTAPNALLYDLPLSGNLVPALASLPGPATLSVTITVADAAGNRTTAAPIALTWHTIGAPLAISEDASYTSSNDPKGSATYKIGNGTYGVLFDPTNTSFLPDNQVRLIRYIVTNPGPAPVGLAPLSFSNGWSVSETWSGTAGANLGLETNRPVSNSNCSGSDPCGSATYCPNLIAQATATDAPVPTSAGMGSSAYLQSAGSDLVPAPKTAAGQFIVPGASGAAPGLVALYIGRPVSVPSRSYASTLSWDSPVARYDYAFADIWTLVSYNGSSCCDLDVEFHRCLQFGDSTTRSGTRYMRTLTSARDVLGGSFQLVTNGLSANVSIGEPSTVPGLVILTRSISH